MDKNPFKFGEIVKSESFCNRKKEIARLKQSFSDGQNVVLISPRRWGKSSLVNETLARFKGKIIAAQIDCFGITSTEQFLEIYLKTILKASSSKFSEITEMAKRLLKAVTPFISFSIGEADEIKIALSLPKERADPKEILNLPERLAKEKDVPIVVCVDEFQKIQDLEDGLPFLETLRSAWQKHTEVSYCLYGSKRHLMAQLFNDSSRPFFRFGDTIFLEKISKEDWLTFIQEKFENSGKKISDDTASLLIDKVQAHSYYVQYLARLCWNNSDNVITNKDVEESFVELLSDKQGLFRAQTEKLTMYQVNYLKAFISGETKMSSSRVINDYKLGTPGNIKRIEKALQDAEIIDFFSETPELSEPYFEPLFRKHFMPD